MIDARTFRAVYPAFGDLTAYAPEAVDFWITKGKERLDPFVWANLLEEGIYLFVAHKLTLQKQYAASGTGSGGASGPVSSKSVGGVSVAYNTTFGEVEGGGAYNLTVFGKEFLALARLVGIGGIQL